KLSGGQQVRLLLAGTLASNANITLLDDPLDQLDPAGCDDFIAAASQSLFPSRTVLCCDRHYERFLPFITDVLPIVDGTTGKFLSALSLEEPQILEASGIS